MTVIWVQGNEQADLAGLRCQAEAVIVRSNRLPNIGLSGKLSECVFLLLLKCLEYRFPRNCYLLQTHEKT